MKIKYSSQELNDVFDLVGVNLENSGVGPQVHQLVLPDLEPGDAIVVRQIHLSVVGDSGVYTQTGS